MKRTRQGMTGLGLAGQVRRGRLMHVEAGLGLAGRLGAGRGVAGQAWQSRTSSGGVSSGRHGMSRRDMEGRLGARPGTAEQARAGAARRHGWGGRGKHRNGQAAQAWCRQDTAWRSVTGQARHDKTRTRRGWAWLGGAGLERSDRDWKA